MSLADVTRTQLRSVSDESSAPGLDDALNAQRARAATCIDGIEGHLLDALNGNAVREHLVLGFNLMAKGFIELSLSTDEDRRDQQDRIIGLIDSCVPHLRDSFGPILMGSELDDGVASAKLLIDLIGAMPGSRGDFRAEDTLMPFDQLALMVSLMDASNRRQRIREFRLGAADYRSRH